MISDRDPRLNNPFFQKLAALHGTFQRLTTAHRPQGNGQAEALNKELITKLRAYCLDPCRVSAWHISISHLTHAYNTTVHRAHGFATFYLLHGYSPSSAYTLYIPSLESQAPQKANRIIDSFRRYHAQCMMQARSRLEQDAERRKLAAMPASHRLPRFSVGDLVCLSVAHLPTDSLDSKLSPSFIGHVRLLPTHTRMWIIWTSVTSSHTCIHVLLLMLLNRSSNPPRVLYARVK
jgi:hypothetical protein